MKMTIKEIIAKMEAIYCKQEMSLYQEVLDEGYSIEEELEKLMLIRKVINIAKER